MIYYAEFNDLGMIEKVLELGVAKVTPKTLQAVFPGGCVARISKEILEQKVGLFVGRKCIFRETKEQLLEELKAIKDELDKKYDTAFKKLGDM